MHKILFFDTETSGLDPKSNDIIQLAYILEVDGKIVLKNDLKFRPINENAIEEKALEISGHTKAQVMEFPEASIQYKKFESDLSKHIDKFDKEDKAAIGGYNAYFDYSFLMQLQNKLGIKYGLGSYFNHRIQDPLMLLNILYVRGAKLPYLANLKLKTVCEAFNIPIKAHDAFSDIEATRELYYKLLGDITYCGEKIL